MNWKSKLKDFLFGTKPVPIENSKQTKKNDDLYFWDNYLTDYQKGLLPHQIKASEKQIQFHLDMYKNFQELLNKSKS